MRIAAGSEEHPRNDSASIVELSDGSLYMVWMEFLASNWVSADEAPDHICSMVSRDGGRTWGDYRVELETDPGDASVYNPSCTFTSRGEAITTHFTSPMDGREPPGKWGNNPMSLDATIVDVEWFYRRWGRGLERLADLDG